MPASILSAAVRGIEGVPVTVEVDVLAGLPSYTLVGLGDTAIKESKERLTSALSNCGFEPPRRKTIVSLAPASMKKEGSLYDLPIAVGYLMASGQLSVPSGRLERQMFIGEVGLDGQVRAVRGILPIALMARSRGITDLYVPADNGREAAAVGGDLTVWPVRSLQELVSHLSATSEHERVMKPVRYSWRWVADACEVDFGDIRGQELAKRALLLAAAGGHNVLMVGPPGTGKTLLARALAGILPPLTREESLAVTSLYSVAGELSGEQGFVLKRPFRKPHHGASGVSLVGGGAIPKPGEVSLAHRGVLFLDELPEFSRQVLDQLRQPIEDGEIVVSRAQQTVAFPAQSMVVAAMNPCKCGYLGSRRRDCSCASGEVLRYQRRVSGPLLDRFDLHVVVEDIGAAQLLEKREQRPVSKQWQQLAVAARRQQASRQHKLNEQLSAREVGQYCVIAPDAQRLIEQAEQKFTLSGRAIHRTLKVARTIADLAHEPNIKARHVGEALQYREQLRAALPNFV